MNLSMKSFLQPTVMLAIALMVIIVMMVLPAPAWVVDVGLTASFALAILILTITLFIDRPLDFSSFPTILLSSLLLRLSLNVSSTKLIISQGHTGVDAAGGVIKGFAMFIMGGNVFLGLVIFVVLLIVNFMVITKGAGRMAEVGARFALDGMPGKQLAIDSDIAAGAISHEEAKVRRQTEQEETTFFGSLDGASKFVKGDAIAGLLITLLNLVVGLAIGIGVHNLSLRRSNFDLFDPDGWRRPRFADSRGHHFNRRSAPAFQGWRSRLDRSRTLRSAQQVPRRHGDRRRAPVRIRPVSRHAVSPVHGRSANARRLCLFCPETKAAR